MVKRGLRGSAAAGLLRVARHAGIALAAGIFAGCASVPQLSLYDETRAKQAAAVRDDWKKVDVSGVIAAGQSNLKALLDAENANQDAFAKAQAATQLTVFLDAPLDEPSEGLGGRVEAQLRALLGEHYSDENKSLHETFRKNQQPTKGPQVAAAALNLQLLSFYKPIYAKFGVNSTPSCADVPLAGGHSTSIDGSLAKLSVDDRAFFTGILEKLRARCQSLSAEPTVPFDTLYGKGGTIAKAAAELKNATDENARAAKAEVDVEKDCNEAKDEYQKYLDSEGSKTPAADKVQALVTKLQDKLKALDAVDTQVKTLGSSAGFAAQQRLAEFEKFLGEVGSGVSSGAAPGGAPPSVSEVVLLTRLVDDVHALRNARQRAQELPLQLMAEQQRLTLQAAEAATAARKTELDRMQQIQDNMVAQAKALASAGINLDEARVRQGDDDRLLAQKAAKARPAARDDCDPGDVIPTDRQRQTMVQMFCASSPRTRVFLLQATVSYLTVVERLQPQWYKLQYARLDAIDQQAMAYDAANLQRWQALIDPSVQGLADYYASGIAPKTLADLLSAVSLLWIGHGVNK